jgi:ATP-dependent DNA helicase DinG
VSQVVELLGRAGPFARALGAYEERPGQLEMARAVETALDRGQILVCEAGTGTGKTLAYLVPALLSGKKVIVSTATKALQQQIVDSDLPLIQRALGELPETAVMKGLGNYLCRRRFEQTRTSAESGAGPRSLARVEEWVRGTLSGDFAELAELRETDPIFSQIAASSETRVGPTCPYFEDCFVTKMKRQGERAQLVVVNHHLFFADLALRGPHPGRVLPDYDAVIFDEAHQLEDIATDFFGLRVTTGTLARLGSDLGKMLEFSRAALGEVNTNLLDQFDAECRRFWIDLGSAAGAADGRVALGREIWRGAVESAWHRLDDVLEGLAALAGTTAGRWGTVDPAQRMNAVKMGLELSERRAAGLRDTLRIIAEGSEGRVTWFESSAKGSVLSSSPVDVSAILRERVFESVYSVILTSATLSDGVRSSSQTRPQTHFGYLRSRLGLDQSYAVSEENVPSPFDFEHNALLYLPTDLPDPNTPEFLEAAAQRCAALVNLVAGGCFVLTTSLRSMRALHRRLSELLPERRVQVQGEAPKHALLGGFKLAEDGVLVATQSFWEGVDVPGRALRLVILEKVPFGVPTDPIAQARAAALEADGKNPFVELQVPLAAIRLKQGFGRLIRTSRDSGIVALLDRRVHERSYGKRILSALPPARRTSEWDDVLGFAQQLAERDASAEPAT